MARRYDDDDADRISIPIVLAFIPILGVLAFVAYRWAQANDASQQAAAVERVVEADVAAPAEEPPLAGGADTLEGDAYAAPDLDIDTRATAPMPDPEPEPVLPALEAELEPELEPAPEPKPAVPQSTSVTVYFELMKASLTPEAADLLAAQMRDLSSYDIVSVRIDGYTDTAGVPSYNAPLSRRRAETVRAALIDLGAPSARVSAEGHGETQLAVPTPDGVREPGNRRAIATITVQ